MRFLHTADVHLDSSLSSRSAAVRGRLRDASRLAFQRLADLALAERVDAVLIAGDLFDDERLSFQTERFILEQLAQLNEVGIPVVYATGNHDPGREGLRSSDLCWPSNVTVARDREVKRVTVEDANGERVGVVSAVGHATSSERDDLSGVFPPPEGHLPEVAVLHTQVVDSPGSLKHGEYAPSNLDRLRDSGHDVRLLRQVVVRDLHDRVRDVLRVRDRSRDEEVRAALHRMIPPPSPWTLVMGIVLGLAASVLVLLFGDRTGALPLAVAVAVAEGRDSDRGGSRRPGGRGRIPRSRGAPPCSPRGAAATGGRAHRRDPPTRDDCSSTPGVARRGGGPKGGERSRPRRD